MNIVNIYTDGSAEKLNKSNALAKLGIGAYCEYNGVEYSLSMLCDETMLAKYGITSTEVSNPTAEFVAFNETLDILRSINIPGGKINPNLILRFHIDYIGIGKWVRNEWKANKDYIRKLRDFALDAIVSVGCVIDIVHVKGHCGIKGNELADQFAFAGRTNTEVKGKYMSMKELSLALIK